MTTIWQQSLRVWQDRNLFERIPRLVYSIVLVVLAMFSLALYFSQQGHRVSVAGAVANYSGADQLY